ncbi:MAG: hypothetical protein KGI37_04820 [Alphaproteobacteria bacterium]|nr:hypothetical protein [Alphaproteobacteria bacterium]
MIDAPDILGLTGISLSTYSYARVQWQRDYAKKLSYSVLNLVGMFFLITSLFYHWNLASFVSSIIWALISSYGIYRCWKYSRQPAFVAATSSEKL